SRERLLVGARVLARSPDAYAGRGHQRRRPVLGHEFRVGTLLEEQTHQGNIDRLGGQEKRRGANPMELIAIAVLWFLSLSRVHVGPALQELLDEIEAVDTAGGHGTRKVET